MRSLAAIACLILLGVTAGCASPATTQVDRVAPSTTLANTAPDQLDLTVHLTLGNDFTQPDRANLTIIVSAQGKLVQFTRDERMTCNGMTLSRYLGAFEVDLAVADVAGNPLQCTYTSGQTTGTLTGTVPVMPSILAPRNGEQLTRSAQTLIRYQGASPPFHLVALSPAGKVFPADATLGPTQSVVDTRTLTPGTGTITLGEALTPFRMQGTAFHSLGGDMQLSATVKVIWL